MNSSPAFGDRFERLFTNLCSRTFLKGCVFHSPKFFNPTEQEAGDVLLWIRRFAVNFELISHNLEESNSTKQFAKRIGQKRDQLVRDYSVFNNQDIEIELKNELEQHVIFDRKDLGGVEYLGVVLVDCEIPIEKLHFGTVKKAIEAKFPLAFMTLRGFYHLLEEVDTIPDLVYYLKDRSDFLEQVYLDDPRPFLDLNLNTERNLIAFYKLHENKFVVNEWDSSIADDYPRMLTEQWSNEIALRNEENATSFTVDQIADYIREASPNGELGKLHGWELSMLSRRQRATGMGEKIKKAFFELENGRKMRWFANFNQATGCWILFYFRYGGSFEHFVDESRVMGHYKLAIEVADRAFEYSIFVYGFWKSESSSETAFDRMCLDIVDADEEGKRIASNLLSNAREFFSGGLSQRIREFPLEQPNFNGE